MVFAQKPKVNIIVNDLSLSPVSKVLTFYQVPLTVGIIWSLKATQTQELEILENSPDSLIKCKHTYVN